MRSPPIRLEWYIASSASLMISSESCVCGSESASPMEAVRKISRSLKAIGARMVLRMVSANAVMRAGSCSDIRIRPNWSPASRAAPRHAPQRVLRLENAGEAARQRQQDGIADRNPDGVVDLLEAVEVDHHQRRPQVRHG